LRTMLASGFEQVHGADGVDVEVVERKPGGAVVRGLGGAVDNEIWTLITHRVGQPSSIADVQAVVGEALRDPMQAFEVPGGVAIRTEEVTAHVVIHAMDLPTALVKEGHGLGANQAAAA